MSKSRNRNFCGVCYEEHIDTLRKYLKEYTERGVIRAYYFIMHSPETEEKQLHFHFLIEFYDAKTVSSINKKLEFRDGLIEVCVDVRSYACYLIHKYELDKKRYKIEDVETNDKSRFVLFVSAENSNQCCNDKLVFNKFCQYLDCVPIPPFDYIIRELCKDKNITIKTVRNNIYLYKLTYESAVKTGERGFK